MPAHPQTSAQYKHLSTNAHPGTQPRQPFFCMSYDGCRPIWLKPPCTNCHTTARASEQAHTTLLPTSCLHPARAPHTHCSCLVLHMQMHPPAGRKASNSVRLGPVTTQAKPTTLCRYAPLQEQDGRQMLLGRSMRCCAHAGVCCGVVAHCIADLHVGPAVHCNLLVRLCCCHGCCKAGCLHAERLHR